MPSTSTRLPTDAELSDVAWYHTIELPDGRLTPGRWDTVAIVDRVGLPASLEGKRCLDIGSCDGFWAFELERRGAAQVVATDVDDPTQLDWPASVPVDARPSEEGRARTTFGLAAAALGSSVERIDLSVYDLSPERIGTFDFVFMGNLLLHLRDPIRALESVRSVTGDLFLSNDSFNPTLSILRPRKPAAWLDADGRWRWWTVNLAGRRRMIEAAGFEIVWAGRPYILPWGPAGPAPALPRPGRIRRGLLEQFYGRVGAPNAPMLCRPAV
jgi:tRNA (mo5U34)-methyltransferase